MVPVGGGRHFFPFWGSTGWDCREVSARAPCEVAMPIWFLDKSFPRRHTQVSALHSTLVLVCLNSAGHVIQRSGKEHYLCLLSKATQFHRLSLCQEPPQKKGPKSHCWVQPADTPMGPKYVSPAVGGLAVHTQADAVTIGMLVPRKVASRRPRRTESSLIFNTRCYAGSSSHPYCSGLGIPGEREF